MTVSSKHRDAERFNTFSTCCISALSTLDAKVKRFIKIKNRDPVLSAEHYLYPQDEPVFETSPGSRATQACSMFASGLSHLSGLPASWDRTCLSAKKHGPLHAGLF